ncbi:hypothetical protein VTL71DRAFT_6606, partial [Oculimacula yallundae]
MLVSGWDGPARESGTLSRFAPTETLRIPTHTHTHTPSHVKGRRAFRSTTQVNRSDEALLVSGRKKQLCLNRLSFVLSAVSFFVSLSCPVGFSRLQTLRRLRPIANR